MVSELRPLSSWRSRVGSGCEALCRGSLLIAAVLLPWSFGGVDAFSQYLMFVFLTVAEAALLVRLLVHGRAVVGTSSVAAPLFALLLLGLGQVFPLSSPTLATLSPQVVASRTELLSSEAPDPAAASIAIPSTISTYAPATRKETAILLAGLTVLLIAMQVWSRPSDLILLSMVLALNGAAIAYFGIVQKLSWNGQLFWAIPSEGSTPFGPFVNRNGAGGYLVLCLAGLIPMTAALVGRWRHHLSFGSDEGVWSLGHWLHLPREAAWVGLITVAVSLLAGLLAAMSRGAWGGAICLAAVAVVVLARQNWPRGVVIGVVGVSLLTALLLGSLSLQSELSSRVASISQTDEVFSNSRWSLWQDSLRIVPDYWRAGCGLGTFGFIQPQYQTDPMRDWANQAENLFLQAFVEAGVPGGLLLLAAVVLSAWSFYRIWRTGDFDGTIIAAVGLGAIAGQVVCASFDFSLRYPANHWALALVVGGALGAARRRRMTMAGKSPTAGPRWRTLGLHTLLLAGVLAAWWEVAWSGGTDLALVRGQKDVNEQTLSTADMDETAESLDAILRFRPDDAEARLRLAELHFIRYRQAAFRELKADLADEYTDRELWDFTAPTVLHARAGEFARTGDTASLTELRQEPLIQEHVVPALKEARLARQLGPFLIRPHRLVSELQFLDGDPLQEASHIGHTTQLQPQNPEVRYWAGQMHWDCGRFKEAIAEWQKCLALAAEYDDRILNAVNELLTEEEIVRDVMPQAVAPLMRLASRRELETWTVPTRMELGEKLDTTLGEMPASSLRPGEWEYAAGTAALLRGRLTEARDYLRQATALDAKKIEWRLLLASLLKDLGETREAIREAEACVRLAPEQPAAKALLQSLIDTELNPPRLEP